MKLILLLGSLCIVFSGATAQPYTVNAEKNLSNLKFEHISLKEGLSHSIINCILKDSRGFMWFGTPAGLNLYDGYSFHTFKADKNGENSLNSNMVKSLAEDNNGLIWIGTDFGVTTFDYHSKKFTHIQILDEPRFDPCQVNRIIIGRYGDVWAGTWENGLYKYDKQRNCFLSVSTASGKYVRINDMIEDQDGDLWLAGSSFTKYEFMTETLVTYPYYISGLRGERDVEIKDIEQDTEGTIWLATFRNGLYKFSTPTQKFMQFDILPDVGSLKKNGVTDYELNALEIDEWSNLWIGTNQGLYIYDRDLTHLASYENQADKPETLNSNEVRAIYYDSSNDLVWLGTLKGGINKSDLLKKEFQHLKFDSDSPNTTDINNVTAIYEDNDGYLWIGTWAGGLIRYHRPSGKYLSIRSFDTKSDHLPGENIAAINEDKYGNIWLASWRGYVTRIDAASRHSAHLRFINYNRDLHKHLGFEGWDFRNLYKDSHDDLWIVSFDAGLLRIVHTGNKQEPVRFVRHYMGSDKHDLPSDKGWAMIADKSGAYWIAMEDGLCHYDNTSLLMTHDENNTLSLSNNSVRLVFEDSDLNLWVGTGGGGLNKLDRKTGTFIHYTEEEGLPNDMIYGILEDNEKNLWISTENGISKFNTRQHTVKNYEENDGLQGNEFNIGAYYKNPATGEMFFGGTNGITFFYPEHIRSNPYQPKVLITDFKLFNKSVSPGRPVNNRVILEKDISETEEITLGYQHNFFSFDLIALHYSAPEKNRLSYKMEGFDKAWIDTDHKKASATYTNLNPGLYTFMVKAANNDGLWSDTVKTIRVRILPPFWNTWWFRIGVTALALIMAFSFLRLRISNIKRQKKELEKLVYKRTLEIEKQKKEIELQKDQLARQTEELTRVNGALTSNQGELEKQNTRIIEQMIKVKGMAMQLHDADQRKLQFFTNISHEIRTPLTLITGPLEKLMQTGIPGHEKQLNLIHTNVRRLSRLVDQVMDIRKLEHGGITLHQNHGDLIAFVVKIKDSFSFLAPQKNIALRFFSNRALHHAWFDPDKLEKIIYNLLSNAFKFTPAGGEVSLKIDITQTNETLSSLELTVSDTGIGISETDIPRIFDRFFQVQHVDSVEKGMGVGLALVRELIRLHQGTIAVQSHPGEGSTFTVVLPLYMEEPNIQYQDTPEKEYDTADPVFSQEETEFIQHVVMDHTHGPEDHHDATVMLVVEDNSDIRHFIRDCFQDTCTVYEAANGVEGFELAKKVVPDIIISDIMMPGMDGISFCRSVKENETTSHIPVILLTAKAHDDFRIRGLETGADDYIVKPFQTEVLKLKVQNFMKARKVLQDKFSRQLILKPSDISVDSRDEAFVKKAIHVAEEHIGNPSFSVDDFCDAMNVSHVQLYRKLQTLTGQSPNEFIKRIRLQRAVQLLSSERYSIAEIGYQVGFSDPSYFIRCFKKHFGKTPGDYTVTQQTV